MRRTGLAALLLAGAFSCRSAEPAGYVESERCAGCHPREADLWRGSHHDRAMELASPATVLGDFGGVTYQGVRFRREGESYFIDTSSTASTSESYRVRYTFGFDPLQQYLLELPDGRLQAFSFAWDVEKKAWFRVGAEDLHWKSRYQTWNTMCAECHSTGIEKRYDPKTDRFDTTYGEIDVGCQSCHGPGSRHVTDPSSALSVNTGVDACAPCHSRRSPLTAKVEVNAPYFDQYRPMTLQGGLYHPDGQILDEVFEYGSFTQSAMYERGVACIDCHDPHSGRASSSNATCTQCHGPFPPTARFPSLAARKSDLDQPAHHHHAPGSEGARCVGCHMPEETYLRIDERRDHSFRVPRPDLTVSLGVPNACNGCHADRDARWAAAKVAEWFPGKKPVHFGEIFQRGRPEELTAVATDRARPAIVRATALELLWSQPAACVEAAGSARNDPSPLVRSTAIACGEHLPPAARVGFAVDALADPIRLVRIEAARVLAGSPASSLNAEQRDRYLAARRELEEAHRTQLDRPEGWFNLALLEESERHLDEAAAHYQRALELDPEFVPARANLRLLERVRSRHVAP